MGIYIKYQKLFLICPLSLQKHSVYNAGTGLRWDDKGMPITCSFEGEAFVELHGVGDGIETLQGDHGQGEHAQLAGQHPQESCYKTPRAGLPLYCMLLKLP